MRFAQRPLIEFVVLVEACRERVVAEIDNQLVQVFQRTGTLLHQRVVAFQVGAQLAQLLDELRQSRIVIVARTAIGRNGRLDQQ